MGIRDLVSTRKRNGQSMQLRESEHPFFALQHQMNRLFDDFFRGFEMTPFGTLAEGAGFQPTIDMRETDKTIELTAELPGLTEKEVEVTLSNEGDVLTLRGEKRQEREEKSEGRQWSERTYGAFYRSIPLVAEVDPDKVKATMKNGVLNLTLNKKTSGNGARKKIEVKSS